MWNLETIVQLNKDTTEENKVKLYQKSGIVTIKENHPGDETKHLKNQK